MRINWELSPTRLRSADSLVHCCKPDAGRCACHDVPVRVLEFALDKTDCLAELNDMGFADEHSRLRRGQKLHVEIDGGRIDPSICRDQHGGSHAIVEHGGQKTALHIAGSVAEFGPGYERDFHASAFALSFQYVEPEQHCARRSLEAVQHG